MIHSFLFLLNFKSKRMMKMKKQKKKKEG